MNEEVGQGGWGHLEVWGKAEGGWRQCHRLTIYFYIQSKLKLKFPSSSLRVIEISTQCARREDDTFVERTPFKKHRKNCECCPVSHFIVRKQRLSWIQVLNCQNRNQCLNCRKSTQWQGLLLSCCGQLKNPKQQTRRCFYQCQAK